MYASLCTPVENKAGMSDSAPAAVAPLQAMVEISLRHVRAPEWRIHWGDGQGIHVTVVHGHLDPG